MEELKFLIFTILCFNIIFFQYKRNKKIKINNYYVIPINIAKRKKKKKKKKKKINL